MSAGVRTFSLLQDYLDAESSWRIKEIADLKISVRNPQGTSKKTIIRAAVPLLYAHWEGFIKNSSTAYLDFIDYQELTYGQLSDCFVVIGLKKHISTIVQSKNSRVNIDALEFIRDSMSRKSSLKLEGAIRTESNLSSSVFENICETIGISTSLYSPKFNLINESLLKRRNKIAHGESLDLDSEQFRSLADEVLELMTGFKTDIENAAIQKAYKRVM